MVPVMVPRSVCANAAAAKANRLRRCNRNRTILTPFDSPAWRSPSAIPRQIGVWSDSIRAGLWRQEFSAKFTRFDPALTPVRGRKPCARRYAPGSTAFCIASSGLTEASWGATGFQTLINAALQEHLGDKAPRLEETRRMIREELKSSAPEWLGAARDVPSPVARLPLLAGTLNLPA